MIRQIVLISAEAQGGKTSTARIMNNKLEQMGYKCATIPLAKSLKRLLMDFYDYDGVSKSKKWRDTMQYVGSDIIRDKLKKPMYHCSKVAETIQIIEDDYDFVFIDDVRFIGEAYYIKSFFPQKTTHIKVERLNFESPLTESQRNHQSERGMDGYNSYNCTITSDNGLQNLEQAILESNIINDIIKED